MSSMTESVSSGGERPLHLQLGLTDAELEEIVSILGREPNEIELSMYSIMWSEHCSYKSSRIHLARLPSEAPWVVVGPGENAGVVEIGDGLGAVLRIESHNHPSAVEPFQGAATGVGGIIRDILTMGARPIALADPLRFGPIQAETAGGPQGVTEAEAARNRYLVKGVVSGISSYGNAVGVPTVAGEFDFAPCWSGNPLVNVFCLGVMPLDHLVLAVAANEGDYALLLGSTTGRDGIGGVSVLASAGFDDAAASAKRPSVQVGDPFEEKRVIEACLELFEEGVVSGIQDLGGAGLTCATSETAANGGKGMRVDVAAVGRREEGMVPAEIMASESQERMLAIVAEKNLERASAICKRWGVTASIIGKVVPGDNLAVVDSSNEAEDVRGLGFESSELVPVAEVPAASLSEGPKYERPMGKPASIEAMRQDSPDSLGAGPPLADALMNLLADPSIGSAEWAWRQYDHQLFLNTVAGPGRDATVLRVKGTKRALSFSCDGKARWCELDPRLGAAHTVAEAARNVATTGARPIALVDCMNFGNPEHPEVMWQLSEAVDGIAEACRALDLPVVGGNVSLYNESGGRDIWPTPIVAVLGLIDGLTAPPPPMGWNESGLSVYLLGQTRAELGGSAWAWRHFTHLGGEIPMLDLDAERRLGELLRTLAETDADTRSSLISSVHDCSEGGLAVALAECCIEFGVGLAADLSEVGELESLEPHEALFSESAARAVVSVQSENEAALLAAAHHSGVTATYLGSTGGNRIALGMVDISLDEATDAWAGALERALR
ncbi:MAG: phosphoribosylformylglycinamidine synthase subunit PurL [Acidobacteria bacterium]|nr:MAG: phosphoribosylformylglycinamidine synthase subunit PurL [Acidobacteriota bacterium]